MPDPIRVLLVSPADTKYLDLSDELITHLDPLLQRGVVVIESERSIAAGEDVEVARERSINAADLIAILVGPATPGRCKDSIRRALERKAQEGESLTVLPILLFPGGYEDTVLAKLRPLPLSKVPVNSHGDRDTVWVEVVKSLKSAIEKLQVKKQPVVQPTRPDRSHLPKRAWLRDVLNDVLRTDSDFDAFCGDYFQATYRRFAGGMDSVSKRNLLLDCEDLAVIWEKLQERAPEKCQSHRPLLEDS